ncbi:MAG: conjugative transposon protein TraK [Chitinophagaceae bacterium]|nr:conjugative transposon protein TraK [Chitinophagaceae bacterium]MCO5241266.1 conjugative transposon protein TraK [Chitinophagaceae bacterium]
MLQHLKNIDTAFKHVRLFSAVLIISCTLLCGYCIYYCLQKISDAGQKVYVITTDGKAIQAEFSTRKDNIPVEAKDHIITFHRYFFSFSPDEKAIENNIKKALYLADESAKQQYDALKEKGYYNSVVSGNVSQTISCDSISLNTSTYPYYFRFFGKQQIIRSSVAITRNLVTEGYLRELNERTENNSHAFLIEKWFTVDNAILSTSKR